MEKKIYAWAERADFSENFTAAVHYEYPVYAYALFSAFN